MSLHGLLSVTIGVPNVEQTAAYYAEFGLTPEDDNWFATADGGSQLHIVPPPPSFLHPDDLAAIMTGTHAQR